MYGQAALAQPRGSWLNLLQLIFVSDRDVCALAVSLPWSGRPESVEPVNRSRLPIVLITGGGASLAGLMAFGTAHALLTSRSGRGRRAVCHSRRRPASPSRGRSTARCSVIAVCLRQTASDGVRSLAAGVQFGASMVATLAPATLFNAALRLRALDVSHSNANAASAMGVALASSAAAGWLVTRRRAAAAALAIATLTMTLASGGPLPVGQSMRGLWLSLAFVPIVLAAGVLAAALHRCLSPPESS